LDSAGCTTGIAETIFEIGELPNYYGFPWSFVPSLAGHIPMKAKEALEKKGQRPT
jgi:hypothetical protein